MEPGRGYAEAAIAQRAVGDRARSESNGWLDRCCLDSPAAPLTHTLGYALRGIIEAYRYTGESELPDGGKAQRGRPAERRSGPTATCPGRLRADWSPHASWVCLTGTAQIAQCLLLLHEFTQDDVRTPSADSAPMRSFAARSMSRAARGAWRRQGVRADQRVRTAATSIRTGRPSSWRTASCRRSTSRARDGAATGARAPRPARRPKSLDARHAPRSAPS